MKYRYLQPFVKTHKYLTNKHLLQRRVFLKKIMLLLETGCQIIYVDESSFNTAKKCAKRWVKLNETKPLGFSGRISGVSLILACGQSEVLKYTIREGSNTSEVIVEFLDFLIKELKINDYYKKLVRQNKIFIYLDNASIHTSYAVRRFIESSNMNFIFPPPYSPHFCMTEYVFSRLKKQFYSRLYSSKYLFCRIYKILGLI